MVKHGVNEMLRIMRLRDENATEQNPVKMVGLEDKIKKAILCKRCEYVIPMLRLLLIHVSIIGISSFQ